MRKLLMFLYGLAMGIMATAQSGAQKEEFVFSYVPLADGAQFRFESKLHAFSIDVASGNIRKTDDSHFVYVDNHVLQVSVVPLTGDVQNARKLSVGKQKEWLDAYVNYELSYFRKDLNLNYRNLSKEWMTIDSKLWIVWSFEAPKLSSPEKGQARTKSQLYASTLCYNQVLDLNTALLQGDDLPQSKELLFSLMKTLHFTDKDF